uniref:ERVV2 protein n=1 Tax=Seriola dumerili TaxID=41447 RepID=A0A3B4V4J2_SERDU
TWGTHTSIFMATLDQIRDLSHAVEDLANSTARDMSLFTQEMTAIRMMTLQNCAALDYLLASQGGISAIIGTECCTVIPNNNATIQNYFHIPTMLSKT